jgi:hypothetical protein
MSHIGKVHEVGYHDTTALNRRKLSVIDNPRVKMVDEGYNHGQMQVNYKDFNNSTRVKQRQLSVNVQID